MYDYKAFVEYLRHQGILVGDEHSGFRVNPYLEMPRSLGFSDVAIAQGMNQCESRLDANIRSEFVRGLHLNVPLIASNMSSVVNADFCITLSKQGALGIMHRAFADENDYIKEVRKIAENCPIVAVSVGAGPSQVELATKLIHNGANVVVIDIAQGYSDSVIQTGYRIKQEHPYVKLVVGNTINTDLMYRVNDFADGVKVGIAQGSACLTKNTAGCTEKQFSAVLKFKEISRKLGLPIISDGGTKEPADFTKAIAAGANSIMAGQIFARCPESAADNILVDGIMKKMYFGMASREAQNRWRGGLKSGTCPEGQTLYLDLGESAAALVERYGGALRSGITYAGATDVRSFQDMVRFVRL